MGEPNKIGNLSDLSARWQALSTQARRWVLIGGGALIVICGCGSLGLLGNHGSTTTTHTGNSAIATHKPTQPAPTHTPVVVHYPPTTKADLQGLAAKGNASAIHEFHSESVGLTGVCPQPKREVTVDPSITGQQLAEDLLAYFYGQHLDDPCGSLVIAYHDQSEADNTYTAGRINFDVTDASGQPNVDPNGKNLKYTLTLDTGDALSGQEYMISY